MKPGCTHSPPLPLDYSGDVLLDPPSPRPAGYFQCCQPEQTFRMQVGTSHPSVSNPWAASSQPEEPPSGLQGWQTLPPASPALHRQPASTPAPAVPSAWNTLSRTHARWPLVAFTCQGHHKPLLYYEHPLPALPALHPPCPPPRGGLRAGRDFVLFLSHRGTPGTPTGPVEPWALSSQISAGR